MAIENISGRMRVPISGSNGQKVETGQGDKISARPAGQTDSVAITATAQELKKTLESSSSAEVIDMDRVNAVKQALADGNYKIDAESIANKMMQHEQLMAQLDKTRQ